MNKIEIIDNFLNKDDFEDLEKFLMSPRSQWRFVDFIAHKDGRDQDKDGYFVHSFTDRDPNTFLERFEVSSDYEKVNRLMDCIKKKLNCKAGVYENPANMNIFVKRAKKKWYFANV